MTPLGRYLRKKSINRASITRKTNISAARMSELCNNKTTQLKVKELYLIATSIEQPPCQLLEWVCREFRKNRKTSINTSANMAEESRVVPRRRRTRKRFPK